MPRKALVVVFGELARSPRMQYHCMSLANNNYEVTVIANSGDKACDELESDPNIKQKLMADSRDFKNRLPLLLAYAIKLIWQIFVFIHHLAIISRQHVIIVQNPPSIPTLPILCLYSKLTGAKLIIDWHNYGYSILNLNLKTEWMVRTYKWIEIFFGGMANAGFCVSEAMREELVKVFHITYPLYVLYDKPPKYFKPLCLRAKHNFFLEMKRHIPEFEYRGDKTVEADCRATRFTITDDINKNLVMVHPYRPAIIFSSTSWTEDEDFDILLKALKNYDTYKELNYSPLTQHSQSLPKLVCVITGRGPLKTYYQEKIWKDMDFIHVDFVLPWLNATDYPKMVASCDLGISLHKSSSNVDLPMKVVDMFGCGIPVLAYNYKAISELVIEDFYGLTFNNSDDLTIKLIQLLQSFYTVDNCSLDEIECSPLGRYKKNIKRRFLLSRWEDNWNRVARPVFDQL